MIRFLASIVFFAAVHPAVMPAQPQNPQPEYSALLAKVQAGDLSIDFKQLRLSYMDSPERHNAKKTSDAQREMVRAVNESNYKEALENAEAVLSGEYVNLDAHFVEYLAYRELQDAEKSQFHKAVFDALLKSITDSGDGKSPKTAFVVISVSEEYVVLRVRGLAPIRQGLLSRDGHSYDEMEARDVRTGATAKLYFNVDIAFKHYVD